ncbi:MAG: hypothetical protein AAFV88_05885 [Planctomycetota bacterium]
MHCCRSPFLLIALILFPGEILFLGEIQGGELASVRLEVRDPDAKPDSSAEPQKKRKRASRSRHDHCDDDDGSPWLSLLFSSGDDDDENDGETIGPLTFAAAIVAGVATAPYWMPQGLLNDDSEAMTSLRACPFEAERFGFLIIDRIDCDTDAVLAGSSWVIDGNVSYATDFDSLDGWGGEFYYDHRSRLGLHSRVRLLEEDLGTSDDHMYLGSLNATIRFAQSETVQMHSGLGFVWLDDPGGSEFGVNWLYRMDWAVFNPLTLNAHVELGKLGDAVASRIATQARFHYRNMSIFVGGEHFGFDDQFIHLFTSGVAIRY